MTQTSKRYDLEDRTFEFARRCREFVDRLPKTLSNIEYSKQLIRASSSIGANYIEANESLSKKDFIMRCKISRKEAKEARYWLRLVDIHKGDSDIQLGLIDEATELMNIFGSIIQKSS